MGGLIVDRNYRGEKIGIRLLNDVAEMLFTQKKDPILFCYQQKLIEKYKENGWIIIGNQSNLKCDK